MVFRGGASSPLASPGDGFLLDWSPEQVRSSSFPHLPLQTEQNPIQQRNIVSELPKSIMQMTLFATQGQRFHAMLACTPKQPSSGLPVTVETCCRKTYLEIQSYISARSLFPLWRTAVPKYNSLT